MKYRLLTLFIFLAQLPVWSQSTVQGRVTSPSGEPLPFATVQTEGAEPTGTTTDARGRFALELPAGEHRLRIFFMGYAEQSIPVAAPSEQPVQVQLRPEISDLQEVVITATRTSRKLNELPVPASLISAPQIERIGALRMDEVLREQTGLQIVSDHGTGLQMQGLNSEYILFLIDGEPVVGRTAGTLDLTRLAVDNIERVEVIQGPSSSLYGSEAMAGVVNIITREPQRGFTSSLRSRYRSFGTLDLSANAGYSGERFSADLFVNQLRTDGYDLNPAVVSLTAPPFQAYTLQPKFSYRFSERVRLRLNGRFYTEDQQNSLDVNTGAEETFRVDDDSRRRDWNLMPTLNVDFEGGSQMQLRHYRTGYRTETDLTRRADGSTYDESFFDQHFQRSEVQYDHRFSQQHITTVGVGYTREQVEATRYDAVNAFRAGYGFFQHQWTPGKRFNLIAGGRYDTHSAYASRFSPKVAAGYTLNDWLKVEGSFGGGYKAPDFRQLLLNFTNPVVGYTVVGAEVLDRRLEELTAEGQIDRILIDPSGFGTIEAETSLAYNFGLSLTPSRKWTAELNAFRNDISNLIETAPVARRTNGQNIFSYFNFDEVITQGVTVNLSYELSPALQLSGGYQYLDTRDQEAVERIQNGEVFRRDPATNRTTAVTMADYGGLPNRSRHSGNAKLFYLNNRWKLDAALRAIYRGRWGVGDFNGNGVIDADREFANGYLLLNLAVNKQLFDRCTLEFGGNNLLDTTNDFEPTLPGRIWYGGFRIDF